MVATRTKKAVVAHQIACIVFYGPKIILPTKVIVEVDKSLTWLEVLTEYLGIKAPEEKGMLICTWKYGVTNPSSSKGWTSSMSETVSSFVSKYRKKLPQYTVKIWIPHNFSKKEMDTRSHPPNKQVITSRIAPEQPNIQVSVPEPMSVDDGTGNDHSEGISPTISVKTEIDDGTRSPIVPRQFIGNLDSKLNPEYCWAYPGRNVHVLADKCLKRNLKDRVKKKVSGVSELTLHRLKHQISEFSLTKPIWEKVGREWPLVCWALMDLFKEDPKVVNGVYMDIFKNFRKTQS